MRRLRKSSFGRRVRRAVRKGRRIRRVNHVTRGGFRL